MSGESRIDVSIVTVVYVVSDHVPPAKTKACSAFLPFQEPWLFSRVTCSHQDLLIVCLREAAPTGADRACADRCSIVRSAPSWLRPTFQSRAVAGKGAAVMLAFDSRASLDSRVIVLHGLGCVMLWKCSDGHWVTPSRQSWCQVWQRRASAKLATGCQWLSRDPPVRFDVK